MEGLSISRTTRQYGNFSERHASRNFFFKSAGDKRLRRFEKEIAHGGFGVVDETLSGRAHWKCQSQDQAGETSEVLWRFRYPQS